MQTTSPTKEKKNLSQNEKRRQTIRKFIITSAVVVIMLALVALVYNVTMLAGQNARNRRLEMQLAMLIEQNEQIEIGIIERQCPIFIEDFSRRYLEMHHRDEVLFIGR